MMAIKKETALTKKHYIVTINPLLNTTEKPEIPGGGYYSDTTGDKKHSIKDNEVPVKPVLSTTDTP